MARVITMELPSSMRAEHKCRNLFYLQGCATEKCSQYMDKNCSQEVVIYRITFVFSVHFEVKEIADHTKHLYLLLGVLLHQVNFILNQAKKLSIRHRCGTHSEPTENSIVLEEAGTPAQLASNFLNLILLQTKKLLK